MRRAPEAARRIIAVTMVALLAGCADQSPHSAVANTEVAPVTSPRYGTGAIPYVPAEVPTELAIPTLGLTAAVRVLDASTCPVLNPPTLEDAYWVECRAKPGSDSDGTVFIIGHSVAHGHGVFNDLGRVSVGDDVVVRTAAGELTYRIVRTAKYGKDGEVQRNRDMLARVPGRLMVVTCYLASDGSSTNENFVVQADLVGAAASRPPES